jgi:uncharacterized protein
MSKNLKVNFIVLSIITLLFTGISTTHAQQPEKRTLQVNGTGEITVKPDTAFISISVESNAKSASSASKDNAEKMQNVTKEIKSIIGKEDKITTAGYTLSPVYQYNGTTKRSELTGYRAINRLNVETNKLDKIGALIDSSINAGATNVDSLSFSASNNDEYRRKALVKAVEDARKTAQIVASASGVKLLRISNISPSYQFPVPLRRDFAVSGKLAMESAPTPIETGELTVSANVSIVYEIE